AFLTRLRDEVVLALVEALHPHVTDVGDVLHVVDVVAEVGQCAAQPVGHGEGAEVAHADEAIARGRAALDAHASGFERPNVVEPAGWRLACGEEASRCPPFGRLPATRRAAPGPVCWSSPMARWRPRSSCPWPRRQPSRG